jgi:hypothetical protein
MPSGYWKLRDEGRLDTMHIPMGFSGSQYLEEQELQGSKINTSLVPGQDKMVSPCSSSGLEDGTVKAVSTKPPSDTTTVNSNSGPKTLADTASDSNSESGTGSEHSIRSSKASKSTEGTKSEHDIRSILDSVIGTNIKDGQCTCFFHSPLIIYV